MSKSQLNVTMKQILRVIKEEVYVDHSNISYTQK